MTEKLLEQLKQVDPVDTNAVRDRVPPSEVLTAIIDSEQATESEPRHPHRARGLALAAAGAAALIAVVSSLPGREGTSPDAVSALEAVAAIASAETPPPSAGGDIDYYKTVSTGPGGSSEGRHGARDAYTWQQWETTEDWVAPDGSGRQRTVLGKIEFGNRQDVRDWREAGSPRLGPAPGTVTDKRYGPGELNGAPYEGELPPVRELPADADELERIFREEQARSSASVPVDAKLFEYAASVLLSTGSRPQLRAAVYELLTRIDGVELEEDVEDPLGRRGTGVSLDMDYSGAPTQHTVIFDSETSYPLAYTEEPIPPQPKYLVITIQRYFIALEESGRVPDLTTRP
jgi:hypothetical protein